jgi:hypothetical protein
MQESGVRREKLRPATGNCRPVYQRLSCTGLILSPDHCLLTTDSVSRVLIQSQEF